jgi:hypothetical protein
MSAEVSDDPRMVTQCVEGFGLAVHVAGVLALATERAALVTSMCNFTSLDPAGTGVCMCGAGAALLLSCACA